MQTDVTTLLQQEIPRAVASALAWSPFRGMLAAPVELLGGFTTPEEALFDIYSLTGLIFVISCYTFPYVFILVANALDRMPGELEDAVAEDRVDDPRIVVVGDRPVVPPDPRPVLPVARVGRGK